jgi:hypothetical protein
MGEIDILAPDRVEEFVTADDLAGPRRAPIRHWQ